MSLEVRIARHQKLLGTQIAQRKADADVKIADAKVHAFVEALIIGSSLMEVERKLWFDAADAEINLKAFLEARTFVNSIKAELIKEIGKYVEAGTLAESLLRREAAYKTCLEVSKEAEYLECLHTQLGTEAAYKTYLEIFEEAGYVECLKPPLEEAYVKCLKPHLEEAYVKCLERDLSIGYVKCLQPQLEVGYLECVHTLLEIGYVKCLHTQFEAAEVF